MIAEHQPDIFDKEKLIVALSSREDGDISLADPEKAEANTRNRVNWLRPLGIDYDEQVVRHLITYGEDHSYKNIVFVTESNIGEAVDADVLVTNNPNVAMFLPIADCAPAVVYDPEKEVVALAHLGRHATVAGAAEATVKYLQEHFDSQLEALQVWMGPAIGIDDHTLDYFTPENPQDWEGHKEERGDKVHLDIQTYNKAAFMRAGVPKGNIKILRINTADQEAEYFSHRKYSDNPDEHPEKLGRFAVVAMLKPQPATI